MFQTQKQMKEVFWQNRLWVMETHTTCTAHLFYTHTHTHTHTHTRLSRESRFPMLCPLYRFSTFTYFIILCLIILSFLL